MLHLVSVLERTGKTKASTPMIWNILKSQNSLLTANDRAGGLSEIVPILRKSQCICETNCTLLQAKFKIIFFRGVIRLKHSNMMQCMHAHTDTHIYLKYVLKHNSPLSPALNSVLFHPIRFYFILFKNTSCDPHN